MKAAGGSISSAETVILTAAAAFAAGVFVVPRLLVADAGRAGILALGLAAAFAIGWAGLMAARANLTAQRSLPLALTRRAGLYGRAWLGLLALFEVMLAGVVILSYSAMAATVVLPGTPRYVVAGLIAAAAFTAARHRVQGLARTVFVSFTFAGTLAVLAFALLLARSAQIASVLPGPHLAALPIAFGAFDAMLLFAGVTSLVAFMPAQARPRGVPAVVVGTSVAAILVAIAYVAAVGTGGPAYSLTQLWPVVSALRTLVLASFVLNRFGLVVVLSWSAFVLAFAAIHIWAAAEYATLAIGSARRRPLLALAATALAFSVLFMGGSQAANESLLREVVAPATVLVFLSWVVLGLAVTARGAGEEAS